MSLPVLSRGEHPAPANSTPLRARLWLSEDMSSGDSSPSASLKQRARCRVCGSPALASLGEVSGYEFVECGRCAFTFAPRLDRAFMAELYSAGFHGPEDGAPEVGWADPSFLVPALALLEGRGPLQVLDFGTGQSFIPDLLRADGHRVIGVDVVPPLRPHPDRLTGDLLELELDAGKFDLVFSFQVFEHLPEPMPCLRELLRLSRPGGLVLIHTDMETPEREAGFREWWYVLPPDHCCFYRHQTFETFLAGTPHRIVYRDPKCVIIEASGLAT